MKILVALLVVTALVATYVVWLRPRLRVQPWAQGFFARIEPIETALWRKSETILWARFKMAVGALLTMLTMFGQVDLSPLVPHLPDNYAALAMALITLSPLALTVVGWIDEQLRKDTTKPLEVVAAPEAVKAAIPEIAAVDAINAQAVAATRGIAAEQGA